MWSRRSRGTYPLDRDDLAGGLLDLLQFLDEVPETRLGSHVVRGKDVHFVQLRMRDPLRGMSSAHQLIVVELEESTTIQRSVYIFDSRGEFGKRRSVSCSPRNLWLKESESAIIFTAGASNRCLKQSPKTGVSVRCLRNILQPSVDAHGFHHQERAKLTESPTRTITSIYRLATS